MQFPPGAPIRPPNPYWTKEEDDLCVSLRMEGMKWQDISARLPGRSAGTCSVRFSTFHSDLRDLSKQRREERRRKDKEMAEEMSEDKILSGESIKQEVTAKTKLTDNEAAAEGDTDYDEADAEGDTDYEYLDSQ